MPSFCYFVNNPRNVRSIRPRITLAISILAAAMIAVAPTQAAMPLAAHHQAHTKGCNTYQCDKRVGRKWWKKHHPVPTLPWTTEASWYEDAGSTACGTHYPIGIASHYEGQAASAGLPCGSSVRICYADRCITAIVQDRGPYIAGREIDLNPGARDALGCPGTCHVRYGLVR